MNFEKLDIVGLMNTIEASRPFSRKKEPEKYVFWSVEQKIIYDSAVKELNKRTFKKKA